MRNAVVFLLVTVVLAFYGIGCSDETVDIPNPGDAGFVDGGDGGVQGDGASDTGTTTDSGPDGATTTYTVGGTASGIAGTGLVLDNAGDALTVAANGAFTFEKKLAAGASYAVTVKTQPTTPKQTCAVTNGAGTVGSANVTNVTVACTTDTYTVGGTVTGLAGTGLVLQNSGKDDLAVSANGAFAFATKVASGGSFAVTVKTQPGSPSQACTVSGGTGTVAGGNVTSVTVNCAANKYTVGGSVSGLTGTLVLENNGGDDLTLNANGTFAFATTVASGQPYAVTVKTQPATQTCTVTGGTGNVGAVNVTSVSVACAVNAFAVGGTLSGLVGTVVLQDNGGDNLTLNANGTFVFATKVAASQPYAVTVLTQPATQTCVVTNATGTIGSADVTNVTVTCTTNSFTVGGTVAALTGTLVLQDNGGDDLTITTNGAFVFATKVNSGSTYAVTVKTQPAGLACTVSSGSGTVTSGNVTGVVVNCSSTLFTVGGNVGGLVGTVVLQNNGADDLSIAANGSFTFATLVNIGSAYAVTVKTQPASQTCTVTNGTGTMGGANVTNVTVACTTTSFSVGGTVSGLTGSVVLQDNGGDDLTVAANGTFTFATLVKGGQPYAVTVKTQPANQACTVTNGSGTMGAANVTSVTVGCVTSSFTIGGTLTGLSGTVVLQDNAGDNLTLNADGAFTFATKVNNGSTYAVTVLTQPISQVCTVTNGSGTAAATVTNVAVTCSPSGATVMVVRAGDGVAGLSSSAAATFLEERNVSDGSLVRTIALPTATSGAQFAMTLAGSSTAEGGLSLSTNKKFVTLAGYAAAPGTATVATGSTNLRVVARVNAAGQIDTSTVLNNNVTGNVRSATSTDGTSFWVTTSAVGMHAVTLGASTSVQLFIAPNPLNLRHAHIFDGQLYLTSSTGAFQGISTVGIGTPTTAGQTVTELSGFPIVSTGVSPHSFAVLDLDGTLGPDTIYLAQDAPAGTEVVNVQKWTFAGGTWTQQAFAPSLVGAAAIGTRGLAAFVTAGGVRLAATTNETLPRLVTLLDNGSAAPPVTVLSTAATNTVYRGVAFSPAP